MGTYVFDRNFRIVGLSGAVPPDQGTVNTNAVDLAQITRVDVTTGKTLTFADRPDLFTVNDLPADLVTVTYTVPLSNQATTFPQKIAVGRGTNQAIVTATPTVVTFNTIFTTSRQVGIQIVGAGNITVQLPGTYLLNASIGISSDAALSLCVLEFLLNGTAITNMRYPLSVGGGIATSLIGSATVDLVAGDAVTVRVTGTSAGNINVLASLTFFEIVQLHAIG